MSVSILVPALALNVAAIGTLAYAIYFRRHQRRDLLGAYVALDLGVFCAVMLLSTQTVSAGLGFGLFGILSIVRLRSNSMAQEEVGYYFVALTCGLIGGLGAGSLEVSAVLYGVLLGGMYVIDHPRLAAGTERQTMLIDAIYSDRAALHASIERRIGGRVMRCLVTDVDYLACTTKCDVRFRVHRAAHGAIDHTVIRPPTATATPRTVAPDGSSPNSWPVRPDGPPVSSG